MVCILNKLIQELHHIKSRWMDIESGIDPDQPYKGLKAERSLDSQCGRPEYIIKSEQLLCNYFSFSSHRHK